MSVYAEVEAAFTGPQTLSFTGDEIFFKGHFPDRPVLPAFVQLLAVRVAIEKQQGRGLHVEEVSRAIFKKPVSPGEELFLASEVEGQRIKARILSGDSEVSQFRIQFSWVEQAQ